MISAPVASHPYQTAETTTLIRLFPNDYTDSRTLEDDSEAAWERHAAEEMEWEYRMDRHIALNYDECGQPFGCRDNPHEEYMERMAEMYDPGLNR